MFKQENQYIADNAGFNNNYNIQYVNENKVRIANHINLNNKFYFMFMGRRWESSTVFVDIPTDVISTRVFAVFNTGFNKLEQFVIANSKPANSYELDWRTNIRGHRNTIINGAMDMWQRGTSFAAIAANKYSADRFAYSKSGAMVHTITQEPDVPTSEYNYSIKIDCTTIDTSITTTEHTHLLYQVEG